MLEQPVVFLSLQQSSDSILSNLILFPESKSAYGWSKLLGSIEMKYAFTTQTLIIQL